MNLVRATVVGLCALAVASVAFSEELDVAIPFEEHNGLPRHAGDYLPRRFRWSPCKQFRQALQVFTHPVLPKRAYVATLKTVFRTDDGGDSWQELPELQRTKAGQVAHIEFAPDDPETIYLASATKGVWRSADGGTTVEPLASTAEGLAADEVAGVYVYPADLTFQTLLAVHGDAATGISVSRDGGKTWEVIGTEHHVHRLVCFAPGKQQLYLVAAKKDEPDVLSLYATKSLGQYWLEILREVLLTDVAVDPAGRGVLVTTSDSGLYHLTGAGDMVRELGHSDQRWSSVEVTWGSNADAQTVCLYEPTGKGLVTADAGDLSASQVQSEGLFVGKFVREGAHIRANATGDRLFAVVNGMLFVGKSRAPLLVKSVSVEPSTMSIALSAFSRERWSLLDTTLRDFAKEKHTAELAEELVRQFRVFDEALSEARFELRAEVASTDGPPAAVTADLSRVGLSEHYPLHDDGAHADGAAADGVFGATFHIDRELPRLDGEWRTTWPGRIPLTVSAVDTEKRLAGAVGVLSMFVRPETFTFWAEGTSITLAGPQGSVELEAVEDEESAFAGKYSLRLTVGPGAWVAPLRQTASYTSNIRGYHALSFVIRCVGKPDEELFVHLRDEWTDTYPAITTPGVPLVAEELVAGGTIDETYRRVTIPVERLLRDTPAFRSEVLAHILLAGESKTQRTYLLDDIRFYLTAEELAKEGQQ